MSYTPTLFHLGNPTIDTSSAVMAANGTQTLIIKQITIANHSSSTTTLQIFVVKDGFTPAQWNNIFPPVAIEGNSFMTLDLNVVIPPNAEVFMVCPLNGNLTLTVSGVVVQ
jgi:hypothetical protein